MITGKHINNAIKDFLKGEDALSQDSGVAPKVVSQAVRDELGGDELMRSRIRLAVAHLLTSYEEMKPSGCVLTSPNKVWLNPNGGRDAHVEFPIKMPADLSTSEVSARGGPSLTPKVSRVTRSQKSKVRVLLEEAEAELQKSELEAESIEVEDSSRIDPALTSGKQINNAIKSFLKSAGATSADSGQSPNAIVSSVQDAFGGAEETRLDVGLAVVALLTSYAEMALSGILGSVDHKAGLYWLNSRGGADAGSGVLEAAAGRSGIAKAGARSRRMESASAEVEEPNLEGLDLGLESSTQGMPVPTVAIDDSHSTNCSQLVKSVVALHNARVIDDVDFKRMIVRISEICD